MICPLLLRISYELIFPIFSLFHSLSNSPKALDSGLCLDRKNGQKIQALTSRRGRIKDEDEDMEGWLEGRGGAICLVRGSLAAQRWAQCGIGECHDVTPAAAAEDDGGPSASHFMWNHFPAKASSLTPSTILWKRETSRLLGNGVDLKQMIGTQVIFMCAQEHQLIVFQWQLKKWQNALHDTVGIPGLRYNATKEHCWYILYMCSHCLSSKTKKWKNYYLLTIACHKGFF